MSVSDSRNLSPPTDRRRDLGRGTARCEPRSAVRAAHNFRDAHGAADRLAR